MSISDTKEERNVSLINLTKIQTDGYISSCYTYVGSLTVPPCSEGVLWIGSLIKGSVFIYANIFIFILKIFLVYFSRYRLDSYVKSHCPQVSTVSGEQVHALKVAVPWF